MGIYRVHRAVDQKDYWTIAPGPACAIVIAAKAWGLQEAVLSVYDRYGNFEGMWSAA